MQRIASDAAMTSGYNKCMSDSVVTVDPQILGGTPCFTGTLVPIASLFEHLESGYSLDAYLAQFPRVRREQAIALLESAKQMVATVVTPAR